MNAKFSIQTIGSLLYSQEKYLNFEYIFFLTLYNLIS